jgi:hypothetical protein
MAWLKKYSLNWPAPVYVLLLAAFPVLYLYAHNMVETNFGDALLALALSLAGGVVLWALLTLILRNARKAGIAVAVFLLLFFTYGRLYEAMESSALFVPKDAFLLPIMLVIWGYYCVYFISRAKRDFRTTTTVLNIAAVALIAINLFTIASYEVKTARLRPEAPVETPQDTGASPVNNSTLPDIYFIIMDEYAHPDTIRGWCGYDNSGFIKSLEDKGFFIASQSKTRAPMTPQCLAQVLNMEYLTPGWEWDASEKDFVQITASEGEYPGDPPFSQATFRKIGYSKVSDFLKAQGYQYIVFGNSFSATTYEQYIKDTADLHFNYFETEASPWVSEFQKTLWMTTMLRPFYMRLVGGQDERAWRSQTLFTMEQLKELPEVAGPKFVFAHLYCPHQLFVFGPAGQHVDPANYQEYGDKQFYRGQYIFMSTEIEKVLDVLLKESTTPPIIILQSDHGLRPLWPKIEIGPDEWHKILNAMYLPGMDYSALSQSISPVNTFRLIFNYYFGANYPLLEND